MDLDSFQTDSQYPTLKNNSMRERIIPEATKGVQDKIFKTAITKRDKAHEELSKKYPHCRIQVDFGTDTNLFYWVLTVFEPVLNTTA